MTDPLKMGCFVALIFIELKFFGHYKCILKLHDPEIFKFQKEISFIKWLTVSKVKQESRYIPLNYATPYHAIFVATLYYFDLGPKSSMKLFSHFLPPAQSQFIFALKCFLGLSATYPIVYERQKKIQK